MAVFYGIKSLPAFRNSAVTIGTFDGVHKGHQKILAAVRASAAAVDGESIVITFEPHPRKLLYPDQSLRLLTPLDEKIGLIEAEGIDHIVVAPFTQAFASMSATGYISSFLVRHFAPKRIVIGYDHQFGQDRSGNIILLRSFENEFEYSVEELPAQLIDEAAVSSTKIRNALTAGDVSTATQMLGRTYSINGLVVAGARLGRTIGYPTANISPESEDQLIPAVGVYAVYVELGGHLYRAMMNIGYKPTVTNEKRLTIEAHILDFDADIYDQRLTVKFIGRLRDELRFPSLDALKSQLALDKQLAQKLLKTH